MHATVPFGHWVKHARITLDLTQEALAERVGCAVQTIRKIEIGARRPSLLMAERLAQVLELPHEERSAFLQAARATTAQAAVVPGALQPEAAAVDRPSLPVLPTCFVGRVAELTELRCLVADPSCRLITLVGPGGIGKTRLAVEAAHASQGFADGSSFVALASINSAALIVPAIATALGFTFHGPEPPVVELLRYLQPKELLLILDNLEHVLDGAGLLAQILEHDPRIKLLVTSRERLNVQGEWVVQLAGLSLVQAEVRDASVDADAVVLFAERARQVQHTFQLSAENRDAVRQICRLLAGMPLGIELAATWVRMLSCAAIAAELERSLDFLQAATRDLPTRHRSMRAVFEHSWQLLTTEEQCVLRQLTVFRGGFTRAAAEQVAAATLPLLSALVDKSLVLRVGAQRYDLHEVVRQYAAAHLQHDPEEHATTHDRHCVYFMSLIADREGLLKSARQHETIAELTAEIDNVRVAWQWAVHHHRIGDIRQAIPTLDYFYEIRGWYQEAALLFQQAADGLQTAPRTLGEMGPGARGDKRLLGHVLTIQAWYAYRSSQYERATELLHRSLALLDQQSDEVALSHLPYLWMLRNHQGDYSAGAQLLRQQNQLLRGHGDQWRLAFSLLHLGVLTQLQGDQREAYRLMQEALTVMRATGDPAATARILGFAGAAAYAIGAYGDAEQLAHESLTIGRRMDDRFAIGLALHALGLATHAQGRYAEAHSQLEQSLAHLTELGDRWQTVRVLLSLGQTLHAVGAAIEAHRSFLEALAAANEGQTILEMLDAVLGLATVLGAHGQAEQATELCLHILGHPASSPPIKDQAEQLRRDQERLLPAQHIVVIEERVRNTDFEAVVTEVLSCGPRWMLPILPPDQSPSSSAPPLVEPLTAREVEVLGLLADGRSYPEIAQQFVVSINTVKTQVQSIYGKLDAHSRAEAVAKARTLHLVR